MLARLMAAAGGLCRHIADALVHPDQIGCYGCHLESQWVGSDPIDHSCAAHGPRPDHTEHG